jgi:predicted pyridoxine 5'-phosphate oxidase superfamily flavin-nucleotide-binding protein
MVNGNHVLRPAIAVNSKGRGAIAITLTGADWFPTAALIPFETSTTPAAIQIAGLGVLPEDGFTAYPNFGGAGVARWGDYNGAVATADGSIWMVAQYIGDFPRTTYANWNTFIMRAGF